MRYYASEAGRHAKFVVVAISSLLMKHQSCGEIRPQRQPAFTASAQSRTKDDDADAVFDFSGQNHFSPLP